MGIKTVVEYEKITRENCKKTQTGTGFDYQESFDVLKNFLLSENTCLTYESLIESGIRNGKEYIKVKNYVGSILLKNGDVLEILPKIAKNSDTTVDELKRLVAKMISAVPEIHNKTVSSASVGIEKLPIFEVFIRMLLNEIFLIVKSGLKHNYNLIEENMNFYKGKINFSQNLKYNYARMERCFSEHDEFNANRPENKLLKSTLALLLRISKSYNNIKDIKILLEYFDDIDESNNYEEDFSKCQKDRDLVKYKTALSWCEVFLNKKSFSPYSGSKIAAVILFPMEALFEAYIAKIMKKIATNKGMIFNAQERKYYLYSEPKLGRIEPDIVLRDNNDKKIYIIDTKWKMVDDKGINKNDIHQMFAYQHKYTNTDNYTCKNVTLMYPGEYRVDSYNDKADNSNLNIAKVNLLKAEDSLETLLSEIKK